jgi:hypothetical protein
MNNEGEVKHFKFDNVFDETISTEAMYINVLYILDLLIINYLIIFEFVFLKSK